MAEAIAIIATLDFKTPFESNLLNDLVSDLKLSVSIASKLAIVNKDFPISGASILANEETDADNIPTAIATLTSDETFIPVVKDSSEPWIESSISLN